LALTGVGNPAHGPSESVKRKRETVLRIYRQHRRRATMRVLPGIRYAR